MSKKPAAYLLLNRHTGKFEEAFIYDSIRDNNKADFDKAWAPAIDKKMKKLKTDVEVADASLQDYRWEWAQKAKQIESRLDYQGFAVEADGITQGMMIVNLVKHRAKIDAQKGLELVQIELLSTAPWNRQGFSDNPKYKGVGRLLTAAAISLSMHVGFKGRIGLFSLPQSESWYREIVKMTDLGKLQQQKSNRYFEMTEEQAKAFVKEGD